MDNVKLRLKLGERELEIEAPLDFIRTDLTDILKKIMGSEFSLGTKAFSSKLSQSDSADQSDYAQSTDMIAALLGSKTGPHLAMAAAANLTLVKGKPKFSRKEILDEMQTATTYYNHNYSGNLTKILQGLTRSKKLNLVANNTYALSKSEMDLFKSLMGEE